jgi:hypothetical protein
MTTPVAPPPRSAVPKLSFPPPKASPPPSSGMAPAIIAGALAALAGAGIWTAVVMISGGWEVGWVAWGIGALVGAVMSRMTPQRSVQIAVAAAVLSAAGLAIGKVATFRLAVPKIARDMLLENPVMLAQAFAMEMREGERFSAEVSVQLASLNPTDTLSDAVAAQMLEEAETRMEGAPPAERERVAKVFANRILADTGLSSQFGATLSAFDLLWFFLAIATAFKLMRGS